MSMARQVDGWRRTDWRLGRVHVIRRGPSRNREYGVVVWGAGPHWVPTVDVSTGRSMWTVRWVK